MDGIANWVLAYAGAHLLASLVIVPVAFLERGLQRIVKGAQHFDPRPALVIGFYQGPGGHFSTGAVHHVAYGRAVFVPLFAVAPVFLSDFEAFERDGFARLKRSSWVSLSIASQNLTTMTPVLCNCSSKSLISP